MATWERACPKCLSDNLEKVGWGFWFCQSCSNIWEVVAASGKTNLSNRSNQSKKKDKKSTEIETSEVPEPGSLLESTNDMDYPL